MQSYQCQICGRDLTSDESIALGVGPECAQKRAGFIASCGTTDAELAAIASDPDPLVNRWARNFLQDMRAGRAKRGRKAIEAGRRALEYSQAFSDDNEKRVDLVGEVKRAA